MRFLTPVALLALLQGITASPVDVKRNSPGLEVTLSQVNNTQIKAVVKNNGAEEVKFVHLNFFQDSSPVKKVSLFKDDSELDFTGIKYSLRTSGLTEDALTTLAPGAELEDFFDIATTSDLSSGGAIKLRSEGSVPLVTGSDITGSLPFSSNELEIEVDGAEAAKVHSAMHALHKRTRIASCSGSQGSALQTALRNTVTVANRAASAASSGHALFNTFFKTTSSSARSSVAARFQAIAREASTTSSGATTYYCQDVYGYCSSNVLAWTLPAYDIIANCPMYYSYLPAVTSTCWGQDQWSTTLHEFTHAPGVYSPSTQDYAYGYAASTALSSSQALNNADSYTLFASGVYFGC
ncbi:Deuterolysin metalloprotease family-domain-containing protein [Aspergillus egyptiacus]|nr:Deuterolysin metalloprotease family-domain-containing protein [Aspergillus egyptiacus]